ncbi:transferrin-binding protein-like solute binding protein [Pasteurella testudinis]|uniref:transferrin-binding protein-like solute binding protein n=1 Tax=Pasteurella testudinis TaxID=761 RepID=UPI00405A0055
MKNRKLIKTISSIIIGSVCIGLTACGGNGGVVDPAANVVVAKPKPKPKPKPVEVFEDVPLKAANKTNPTKGEKNFLSAEFGKTTGGEEGQIIYYDESGNRLSNEVKVSTTGKKTFTGLRKAIYDDKGKLKGFSIGHRKDFEMFNDTFENKKLTTVTTYQGDLETAYIYDAGLKAGGQYAGVYATTKEAYTAYFWRDPAVAGWNYQTYGAFDKQGFELDTQLIYQTVGEATASVPTEKSAVYKGISSGSYGKAGDYKGGTTADVTVNVDFDKRTFDFKTENTKSYALEITGNTAKLADGVSREDLNLVGQGNWVRGKNTFEGIARTTDRKLDGILHGTFYGPNADEVGGVFGVQQKFKNGLDEPRDYYIGAFGARRE